MPFLTDYFNGIKPQQSFIDTYSFDTNDISKDMGAKIIMKV